MLAILKEFGPSRLFFGTDHPVSSIRGRCISVADGFMWTNETAPDWSVSSYAQPTLVGIESLLALKQAVRDASLSDTDVERMFCSSARELLGIQPSRPPIDVQSKYRRAREIIPGGTQLLSKRPEMFAPDRWPAYFEEARGCEVTTIDGKRGIDMSICGNQTGNTLGRHCYT